MTAAVRRGNIKRGRQKALDKELKKGMHFMTTGISRSIRGRERRRGSTKEGEKRIDKEDAARIKARIKKGVASALHRRTRTRRGSFQVWGRGAVGSQHEKKRPGFVWSLSRKEESRNVDELNVPDGPLEGTEKAAEPWNKGRTRLVKNGLDSIPPRAPKWVWRVTSLFQLD